MGSTIRQVLAAGIMVFSIIGPVSAQSTQIPFGQSGHDTTQPVEIVSDSFTVNQSRGSAEFEGNVVVGQGDMRLSAGKITVEYAPEVKGEARKIGRLIASEGVTLVTGGQAAEAKNAVYSLASGNIIMSGNVLITQGENALSGQKITINLESGSARIEGRVRTIFKAGGSE